MKIVLLGFLIINCFLCEQDLYNILGISKSATQDEIRKAYKTLAREWHPDKNKSPNANEKFIKINEAYETLSDNEKRENYNRYGTTSAQNNQMNQQRHSFDGFNFHFGGSPFHFNFPNFGQDSSKFAKHRINYGDYENRIIPQSFKNPTIIYGYVDYCMMCHQLAPTWEQFTNDLDKIGFGVGTLNANHDSRLTQKLGINSVPVLFAIIEGKVKRFSSEFNMKKLREFVRSLFPINLITELIDENYNEFIKSSSVENKITVILFDTRKTPSLRYLAAAFAFRNFVKAAFVNTERFKENNQILNQYKISKYFENLLIFKEDITKPVAQIQMDLIPRSIMNELIKVNKYLNFPRISNPHFFDYVCPSQQNVKIKKLCVLLLLRNTRADNRYKDLFFEHIKLTKLNTELVKFAYVFDEFQTNLIQSITHGEGVANDSLNLRKVIIMMRSNNRLEFDILSPGWPLEFDKNFEPNHIWASLEDLAKLYLSFTNSKFPFVAQMNFQIVDENETLINNILLKLQDWKEFIFDYFTSFDEWTLVAIVTTVVLVIFITFIFKIMAASSDQSFNSYHDLKRQNNLRSRKKKKVPTATLR